MGNIKFRGKREDNGKWVYGFLADIEHINANQGIELISVKVRACTVERALGLKDAKGNDAYFCDIVKFVPSVLNKQGSSYVQANYTLLGTITQDEFGNAVLKVQKDNGDFDDEHTYHIENLLKGEIIGNSWDNPELIGTRTDFVHPKEITKKMLESDISFHFLYNRIKEVLKKRELFLDASCIEIGSEKFFGVSDGDGKGHVVAGILKGCKLTTDFARYNNVDGVVDAYFYPIYLGEDGRDYNHDDIITPICDNKETAEEYLSEMIED